MIQFTIILLLVFALILVVFCMCKKETFSADFLADKPSTQHLQYVDMGDHNTMVMMQRGANDKTVLLLHNNPFDITVWMPLYSAMQAIAMAGNKTPNLISYDIRGHGTAWVPVDPKYSDGDLNNKAWNLDIFVEDCNKIYTEIIGDTKLILTGYGFGGAIAQAFAIKYPDRIEKLVLLQTAIRPMPGLEKEIEELAGPNGRIQQNLDITYLTMSEQFLKQSICEWFYIPFGVGCVKDPLVSDTHDKWDDTGTPQFDMSEFLWTVGSASSTLQVDKILSTVNFADDWAESDYNFPIHILASTEDPLAPPDLMAETYASIRNSNRDVVIVLDIVDGRHGFTVLYPRYIASILCRDCPKVPMRELRKSIRGENA